MHVAVKISCTLLLLVLVQYADSFPQFSIPFVSLNKNKEESSKLLNFRVQNPFSSPFGKNRQDERSRGNNEVINKNEKIITVTPNAGYYTNNYDKLRTVVQTTQDPRIWGIQNEENHGDKDLKTNNQNLENKITFKEIIDKDIKEFNLNDNALNGVSTDNDVTTESTTEYESTTFDESDELYRSGVSGHVVATLLG